jgi:hypothetical protein
MTGEITQIFHVTLYGAVIGVLQAYDYYEGIGQKTANDSPWIMSFCSNVSMSVLNLIPLVIVWNRFNNPVYDTVQLCILLYVFFHFIGSLIKIAWQLYYTTPVLLVTSEAMWLAKTTLQVVFTLTIFLLAANRFAVNQNLNNGYNQWYANFVGNYPFLSQ